MKKRLLSLVLCLVMVFSLFTMFGTSARAEVIDDVYESIDDVTNWTPNSDYASMPRRATTANTTRMRTMLHPVDYSTTDTLWHPDTRTNWTAAAATAGAATSATNSALYYQKTDNLNSKVVVSKTNYFTKQSANNVDCTTNAVEKPSFVNYRRTDLYVYVPHDASSADNGEAAGTACTMRSMVLMGFSNLLRVVPMVISIPSSISQMCRKAPQTLRRAMAFTMRIMLMPREATPSGSGDTQINPALGF